MPTIVCVPIMVRGVEAALADAAVAGDLGADLVEFRVDEFWTGSDASGDAEVERLALESVLPCIVTCRLAAEGGHFSGDEGDRGRLFERLRRVSAARGHSPRYIDVEYGAWGRHRGAFTGEGGAGLILSLHDTATRPGDLMRRVSGMAGEPAAAVLKVAYRARSLRDSLELLDLPSHTGRPTIALGMGEFGLMSRVLAPKFGGFLTFASLRREAATAPGQPTVRELLDLYRFRSIGPATRVYGVVGWPVGHSRSPLVHNAGFGAVGHDGVYLPLPIAAGEDAGGSDASFKGTMLELVHHERLGLSGCSVTIPHKERLVRLARAQGWKVDAAAGAIGAANTIDVERDDTGNVRDVRVRNTDAPALRRCVERRVKALEGLRVAVLGTGGVARAAAWALAGAGATVVVYGREEAKARAFAESMSGGPGKVVGAGWDLLPRTCAELIVNATPVGMRGTEGEGRAPIEVSTLEACGEGVTVMDTVYTPAKTPLLGAAEVRGWGTIDGVNLFVEQAGMQFEGWTGRAAPEGLFERLVRNDAEAGEP